MTEQKSQPLVGELLERVANKKLTTTQRMTSVEQVMRACEKQMMAALPKHVTPDRMIRVAMNCIRKTPKLLECQPASLFSAITEAATYGWELGGVLGHAYLVPYKTECQLIPGYKGLIDLCRRSGQVSTIAMEVVHEGDFFEYEMGDDPRIKHRPNDADKSRDSKPITHVYAVVVLRDGGVQRSVWSAAKIDAHKEKYSQGWRYAEKGNKDSPWHTAWTVMAKKTVIRDMIGRGLIPLSAELRDVAARATDDTETQAFDFASIVETVEPERIEESKAASAADAGMSPVDQFRAECLECELVGAVDLVVEKWQNVEMPEADWTACQEFSKSLQQKMRETRGKK